MAIAVVAAGLCLAALVIAFAWLGRGRRPTPGRDTDPGSVLYGDAGASGGSDSCGDASDGSGCDGGGDGGGGD